MKLSIIIVNHNSQEYLEKCLISIAKKITSVECEAVVVNNGEKIARSRLGNNVRIIEAGQNLGFGKACNLGARQAAGETLWFLNPDTEIISNNISLFLDEFKNNQKLGIIGPQLITEENKIQDWSAGREMDFWDLIKNNLGIVNSKKIWESGQKIPCAWVSGAALLVKKDLFQKLGGFDEKFFMYFEDIDLCRRARQAGFRIIYFPAFVVKHFGGKSFGDKKEQKRLYYTSQDYYFQKHFGQSPALAVKSLRKASSPFRKGG